MDNYIFKKKVVNIFIVFVIFFIGFGSKSGGFSNNVNIAYSFLYLFILVGVFNYKDLISNLDITKTFLFVFLLCSFSISNFLSNFNSEVWYRFFCILSSIMFGYCFYIFFLNGMICFYTINMLLGLIGFTHVIFLLNIWSGLSIPEDYNWVTGLPFFSNIRHFSDFISICFFSSLFISIFINDKKIKFIYAVFSMSILACILWTGSRAAYLGVFFASLVVFFNFNKKVKIYLLFIYFISLIFSLCFQTNNPSLGFFRSFPKDINTSVDQFSSGRYQLYKEILEWISYKPIMGYGGEAVRLLNLKFLQAHNSILQILLEFGVLGLFFVILVFYHFYTDFKHNKLNPIQVFCITIVLNILIASLFNGGAYYVVTMSLMCLYLGGLYAEKNKKIFYNINFLSGRIYGKRC